MFPDTKIFLHILHHSHYIFDNCTIMQNHLHFLLKFPLKLPVSKILPDLKRHQFHSISLLR
ncbi:MAG: hypothetical protein IJV07_00905 [Alphaproteobacteria bacterium]|nr:hypothetical protein [Alphaproteobacteria bacterium]